MPVPPFPGAIYVNNIYLKSKHFHGGKFNLKQLERNAIKDNGLNDSKVSPSVLSYGMTRAPG